MINVETTYYPNWQPYIYNIYKDIFKKIKMDNWQFTYEKTWKKEKTSIFCVYNNENALEKIHIQNYYYLNFSHEFKIGYDPEYAFNVLKTKINWSNIEKLLKELNNEDNWIAIYFVNRIIDKCKKLENK